jgi:hypothetical protein
VDPGGNTREQHITKLEIVENIHEEKPEDKGQSRDADTGARLKGTLRRTVAHREKLYNDVRSNSNRAASG